MRRIFSTEEAIKDGTTKHALSWGLHTGRWLRLEWNTYIEGSEAPNALMRALATVVATKGVATGTLAATFYELDLSSLKPPFATVPNRRRSRRPGVRRKDLDPSSITTVNGYPCTTPLQTLIDIAGIVAANEWEQVLESALRKQLVTIEDIEVALPTLEKSRTKGVGTIRTVLQQRGTNTPPTGSILETMMVQLIRDHTHLPQPERQVEVRSTHGTFIAFVDFAWQDVGLFLECDGSQHLQQQTYDMRRETSVVAATGWLPGRFNWHQIVRTPIPTARRVVELYERAKHLQN